LINPGNPIADRVNSLFCLRTLGTVQAVQALITAFEKEPSSELLKHEICYCLGQMDKGEEQINIIQTFLEQVLEDDKNTKIIMHEAVEALGNLN